MQHTFFFFFFVFLFRRTVFLVFRFPFTPFVRVLVVEVAFLVVVFLFFFTFLFFFRTTFLLFLFGALVPLRVLVVVVAGVTLVVVFEELLLVSLLSWPKASRSSAA